MSEFVCPIGFICEQMGEIGEDCSNYYDCQLWATSWNFPYKRDSEGLVVDISLTYGELFYRDREIWQAEFESHGWANPVKLPYSRDEEKLLITSDKPEAGFFKPVKFPYVQFEIPKANYTVLVVMRKEEGGWDKAEQIPLPYWMWIKARQMSYPQWRKWYEELDEFRAYTCPYLKKAKEIYASILEELDENYGDDIPF